MPKISIIIPVYNAEKYLRNCLDSVLNQSFADWEMLLVDDGSTDASPSICDEYAAKDGRIRVFHKENGGVSSARNLGLDNAKGEYITFIDSDDWWEEGAMTPETFSSGCDVIQIPRNRGSFYKAYTKDIHCPTRDEVVAFLDDNFYNECWGRFYKTSVIGSVRFDETIRMGEDALFLVGIYDRISSYYLISGKRGYHYSDNADSACATIGVLTDLDKLTGKFIKIAKSTNNRLAWRCLLSFVLAFHMRRGTYKSAIYKLGYFKLKHAPVDPALKKQVLDDQRHLIKEDVKKAIRRIFR